MQVCENMTYGNVTNYTFLYLALTTNGAIFTSLWDENDEQCTGSTCDSSLIWHLRESVNFVWSNLTSGLSSDGGGKRCRLVNSDGTVTAVNCGGSNTFAYVCDIEFSK